MRIFVAIGCALLLNTSLALAKPMQVTSPDGNVVISIEVKDALPQKAKLFYVVRYKGKEVIAPSTLGLSLQDAAPLNQNFAITHTAREKHLNSWTPPYGERKVIPDNYQQLTVDLRESGVPNRELQVTFRAYNEGAALRYTIPKQVALQQFTITGEQTQFCFPAESIGYEEHGTEGDYTRVPVAQIKDGCECPLTVQTQAGPVAAIMEADVQNYSRLQLSSDNNRQSGQSTLVSALRSPVTAGSPFRTPWRAILIGDKPGDLLEKNYFVLNLNPPNMLGNAAWIKPGKVIRESTLSTAGGKACVDFAVAHNLAYVEYDAGWYGNENDEKSDATQVNLDPKRNAKGDLNLPEVIEYARQRNVGILLYVNRRALERQMDEILPLYQKWGVRGLKFGFVNVGPQQWTQWINDAVRKAAQYQLMVDIHDAYRPTGLSRPYPNLMTQEGVQGNEHMPPARHNVTLPFTRSLSGAADYTVCYYSDRIKTTRAHQLALSVIMYSPLQFLYWYDRPASYHGEPEIEFFDHVPTVWDDTKVLQGEIGQYIAVARQSGAEWYVGCATGDDGRKLQISLSFLNPKLTYVVHIYSDGDLSGQAPKQVKSEHFIVDRSTKLDVAMAPSGGTAIRLAPATTEELKTLTRYGTSHAP